MTRSLALSVADWLVPWRELDWPIDWTAVFGREAPLALEIGFGNGAFLEREARRRPERNHLGIEVSWTSATYLFRRLDQGGPPHVRALLCDAEVALRRLIAPGALAEVFVHHPCPWPKERHAGRRLLRPDVLALLADRCAPGAPLLIVTDHDAYAAEIGAALEAERALEPAQGAIEVAALPGREPTKYEAKALAQGLSIHYFPWRRAASAGPIGSSGPPEPLPALRRADPMPSVTLVGRAADDLLEGFAPLVERSEPAGVPTVVKLTAAWRAPEGDAWLVEGLVKEDRLQQDLALEVARRDGDRVVIRLSRLGAPHPTFGVKRAVGLLSAWLRGRHPALSVLHHTLGGAA